MSEEKVQVFKDVSETLTDIIAAPGCFLGCSKTQIDGQRLRLKSLYDKSQSPDYNLEDADGSGASASAYKPLKELFISQFDCEQIWQQLAYKYSSAETEEHIKDISHLLTDQSLTLLSCDASDTHEDSLVGDESVKSDSVSVSADDNNGVAESDQESAASDDEIDEEDEGSEMETEYGANQVDDKFFSLAKMEAYLDKQDADLLKNPDQFERMPEMYETDESDSEEHHYKYSDFFETKKSDKSRSFDGEIDGERPPRNPLGDLSSDEEEEEGDGNIMEGSEEMSDEELELMKALDEETREIGEDMSDGESGREDEEERYQDSEDESDAEHLQDIIGKQKHEPSKSQYETRKEKLEARVRAMEEEALSDKPWQLRGEVTAKSRPENSLIQEAVEFDSNVAPVPIITMETTENLESLIIQRIKDKAFDDVERKTRLKEDGEKFRKRIELDHEKSKLSLSQIYEQEYVKLRDKEEDEEDKVDPQEEEIKRMMSSLFSKLDALSSFQFTPKPAPKELKIISHLPSVVVEEVQPDTVADSARLAPEEVKKPRTELKERDEMDSTDKKRIRRQKKAKHRKLEKVKKTAEARVQKINPGLGNKRAEQRSIEAIKQAVVNEGRIIKPSKESVLPDKTYSSSKEFFKALQNEVKLDKSRPKKKVDNKKWVNTKSAEKLKL